MDVNASIKPDYVKRDWPPQWASQIITSTKKLLMDECVPFLIDESMPLGGNEVSVDESNINENTCAGKL